MVPIIDTTSKDVRLEGRSILGQLYTVRSIMTGSIRDDLPPERSHEDKISAPSQQMEVGQISAMHVNDDTWIPPFDLSDLTEQDQETARTMLRKEADSLTRNKQEAGEIKSLQLKVHLKDGISVQKNYLSIPLPLHKEVRDYLVDFINRGWITKSKSAYSSPMVCVKKKDGTLRLCIDYRGLNAKTIPDRTPIPQINDVLNTL